MTLELQNKINEAKFNATPETLRKINLLETTYNRAKRNKFLVYIQYLLIVLISIVLFHTLFLSKDFEKFFVNNTLTIVEIIVGQPQANWHIRTHYTHDEARNMRHRGEIVPKINMTREEERLANVYNWEMSKKVQSVRFYLGVIIATLFGILNAYFYFLSAYKTQREELKSLGEKEAFKVWAVRIGLPSSIFE